MIRRQYQDPALCDIQPEDYRAKCRRASAQRLRAMPAKSCARPGCRCTFKSFHPKKLYCSDVCRLAAAGAARSEATRTVNASLSASTPVEIGGVAKPIREWLAETGVSIQLLRYRIERGWKLDAAITKEVRRGKRAA